MVLTIIGDDKPGIVERLADRSSPPAATGKRAGWRGWPASSRGSSASRRAERAEALARAATADHAPSRSSSSGAGDGGEPLPRTLRLELVGNDHPGIIRDISRVLAQHRVNIEELETDVASAPMSGETLFRARAQLQLPPSLTLDGLRSRLRRWPAS